VRTPLAHFFIEKNKLTHHQAVNSEKFVFHKKCEPFYREANCIFILDMVAVHRLQHHSIIIFVCIAPSKGKGM
jgi:hypothetical protein